MSSTTYQIYAKNKQIHRKVSVICTLSVRISRFRYGAQRRTAPAALLARRCLWRRLA